MTSQRNAIGLRLILGVKMKNRKTLLYVFVFAVLHFSSTVILAQKESLGPIKYAPPKGFQKDAKDHAVVFSNLNTAESKFGFITLYAASASEGTPSQRNSML